MITQALRKGNISIIDNCYYYYVTDRKGNETEIKVSNFYFIPHYLISHPTKAKRIFEIENSQEQKFLLCLPVKDIVSINELKAQIESKGNFILDAASSQIAEIKEHFWYDDEKAATEIDILGFQTDSKYYAFANGIFDGQTFYNVNDLGICQVQDKSYFLAPYSSIFKDANSEYQNEKKFIYKPSDTDFAQWSNLITKVYGNNGKIGIAFLVASLFRDVIFYHTDFFPLLFLFAPPQKGKSTFRESFLKLFGEPQTPLSLGGKSTPKAFGRKLAQNRNNITVFEEYKNGIDTQLIEMLKSVYDGIGYERAEMSNDNRTKSTPVNCSVIVAGQELPVKENALFTRCIVLEFLNNDFTNEQRNNFNSLRTLERNGLGNILLDILKQRKAFESDFKANFDDIVFELSNDILKKYNFPDRWTKNIAILVAAFKTVEPYLNFGFNYTSLSSNLCDNLIQQAESMKANNEINQFWETFYFLSDSGYIKENIHYLSEDIGNGIEQISIDMTMIYPRYVEKHKRDNKLILEQNTLCKYLRGSHEFKEYAPKRFNIMGTNTTRLKKCYVFENKKM